MVKPVLVVDYGAGNLGSVGRALTDAGASVTVSGDPRELERASRLVLPGVGAFASAMKVLRETGLAEAIVEAAAVRGVPLLGVCLGQQILVDWGREGGATQGLGLIPGTCLKLESRQAIHMGWASLDWIDTACPLFKGIDVGACFYFAHGWNALARREAIAAWTEYEHRDGTRQSFNAALWNGANVYGTQFHGEKSQAAGLRVLKNWLEAA